MSFRTMSPVPENTTFATTLYAQLARSSDTNLVFAPYGIWQAMLLAYLGAQGSTKEQIERVMRYGPEPLYAAELFATVHRRVDYFDIALYAANAAWGDQSYPFNIDYLQQLRTRYAVEFHLANFAKLLERSCQVINYWAGLQTQGRISDVLSAGDISPEMRLILLSAVYLRAGWMYPFDETRPDSFWLLNNEAVEVPMMSHSREFEYYEAEGYQVVRLPYITKFSMLVILPAKGQFSAVEAVLNAALLHEVRRGLIPIPTVHLKLPRFQFMSTILLKEALQALGIVDAFDPLRADFGKIALSDTPLFINAARQRTFIRVDEKGTEAAAVTFEGGGGGGMGPTWRDLKEVEFKADRPFLFAIQEHQTELVIFLGRVLDPRS